MKYLLTLLITLFSISATAQTLLLSPNTTSLDVRLLSSESISVSLTGNYNSQYSTGLSFQYNPVSFNLHDTDYKITSYVKYTEGVIFMPKAEMFYSYDVGINVKFLFLERTYQSYSGINKKSYWRYGVRFSIM